MRFNILYGAPVKKDYFSSIYFCI